MSTIDIVRPNVETKRYSCTSKRFCLQTLTILSKIYKPLNFPTRTSLFLSNSNCQVHNSLPSISLMRTIFKLTLSPMKISSAPRRFTTDGNFSKASGGKSNRMHLRIRVSSLCPPSISAILSFRRGRLFLSLSRARHISRKRSRAYCRSHSVTRFPFIRLYSHENEGPSVAVYMSA